MLVEEIRGLQRLGVRGGFAQQLGDVVHDAKASQERAGPRRSRV
jgi:hypothetical protein